MPSKKDLIHIQNKKIFIQDRELLYYWLKEYDFQARSNLKKFDIIEKENGYGLYIEGDFDISMKNLKWIPFKIEEITGTLNVGNNQIDDLHFCPSVVGKNLILRQNPLKNLKNISDVVLQALSLTDSPIESIYYFPTVIKGSINMIGCKKLLENQVLNLKERDLFDIRMEFWRERQRLEKIIVENEMIMQDLGVAVYNDDKKKKAIKI